MLTDYRAEFYVELPDAAEWVRGCSGWEGDCVQLPAHHYSLQNAVRIDARGRLRRRLMEQITCS